MKKITKVSTKLKAIVIILVVSLFTGALFLLRRSMVSPQVALIGEDMRSPANCISQIESISFGKECSAGYFLNSKYTCKNGQVAERNSSVGTCQPYTEIVSEAQKNCGNICEVAVSTPVSTSVPRPTPLPCVPNPCQDGRLCKLVALPEGQSYCPQTSVPPMPSLTPTPTPKPSTPATPPPTSDPNAQPITCKLITQKIPRGMSGWSPTQIIDPAGASILPGEKLGYAVELTNPNKYQVGGTLKLYTTNMAGSNEPVTVDSYGGLCILNASTKTMSCESSYITIAANSSIVKPESVLPSMTIIMEMNSRVTDGTYTGIKFNGSIGNSSFNCEPATSIKVVPNCTTEKPFCLNSLIGKECPTLTTCPTSTATPTPSSSPTSYTAPISTLVPSSSPVTTTTSVKTCGKSLSSWKYRESCEKNPQSYRYIDYLCAGDSVTTQIGNSKMCQTEKQLYASAKEACANRACSTPTPIPTITARPLPTETPRCINIFRWRYCPTTNRSNR